MRMRRVTWPGGTGHPKAHICNHRPQLYNFYGATMTIKGCLHGASPILVENFLRPVKTGPKMAVFKNKRV